MGNRIVTETSSMIRTLARNGLKDNWVKGAVGVMLFIILTITVADILDLLIDKTITIPQPTGQEPVEIGLFGYLYDIFTTPIFQFGLFSFVVVMMKTKEANYGVLFDGFGLFLKIFAMTIFIGVKVFLWSLLLIIPGIVAAINYSQAYFILIDDPSKGINQCVNESIQLMRGNKISYIILSLSFIGWIILAGIGSALLAIPLVGFKVAGYPLTIMVLITYIPYCFVLLYYYAASYKFYELTKPIEGNYGDIIYNQ